MKDIGTHILRINFTSAILHIIHVNICKHRGTNDICHSTKLDFEWYEKSKLTDVCSGLG